jgi:uncharacterized protein (UPF0261 family)
MTESATIVVLGTFDSKPEEHVFLKKGIEARSHRVLTVNVGTGRAPGFTPDYDLRPDGITSRDLAINEVIDRGFRLLGRLYRQGVIRGVISAGGGSGTHICTSIMKALPLGVPKVMVSTVAARNMASVIGSRDITMMHSVSDLLGVNSINGPILDAGAGAICGMVDSQWEPPKHAKRIALTMFGFITRTAEMVRSRLEEMGHEVIAFHANGVGGLAMEELAAEGRFDGILDLATHELADSLYQGGYCRLIGPGRLEPIDGLSIPRLVVPGGLDCIVLEFNRDNVPPQYEDRRIFFYDFRSAIHVNAQEGRILADQLIDKINRNISPIQILIPMQGWSEAVTGEGEPLFDPEVGRQLVSALKNGCKSSIIIREMDRHIMEPAFAGAAADLMSEMLA